MDIGINLTGISYWGTEEPFIDRFHTASSWSATNTTGANVTSSLVFDSEGDPTNLSGLQSLSVSVGVDPKSASPTDQYVITYDGAATVKVTNATIVSQTAGKVVFNYTGGDYQPYVYLTFNNLNASNPLSDVHVVRADQVDQFNAGELFNPAFLDKVSQWGVVRFMDWGNTNDSDPVSWSTRTTLADGSWGQVNNDGVPLEAMVKLANEAHVDMWYNVPTTADDSYVTNALTYIRDHLDPTLKVHVEWSNEVWNTAFNAWDYASAKANALWGNGSSVSHGANIYYGYRSAQVADIANKVFTGTHAGQLVDVLGGQAAGSPLMTYMLQGIAKAGLGSAATLFDDYAVAPYFGGELSSAGASSSDKAIILNWANSGAAGLDAAFHELQYGGSLSHDQSLAQVQNWLTSSATAAQSAGLNLVAYEGGASLETTRFSTTDRATVKAFFGKLMNDPRMGDLYTKLVENFKAAGGSEFLAFNDVSGNVTGGYWGVLDSIYDSSSPRYDALIAEALASSGSGSGIGSGGGSGSTVPTTGNDTLVATAQGGTINALAGNDTITAGTASDTIDGSDGNDRIIGSSSATEHDAYYGGAGADTIVGGSGNDQIWGNEPTSTDANPDGGDSLSGGGGNDAIRGGSGNDTIDGGDGNDYLQGDAGNDLITGGSGNDTLRGSGGNDTLLGGEGDDRLVGESGHDVMTGGAGNDVFSFAAGQAPFTTTGTTAYKTDEITDFTNGFDKFALGFHPVQILQGSATTEAAAATWATQALHSHVGVADVAAVTVGTDTYLFYDDSGKGGALDSAIHLDHVTANLIDISDFI